MKKLNPIAQFQNIQNCIANPKTQYVSFDIFDTLLVRPVIEPSDLFSLMENRIRSHTKYQDLQFKHIRMHSEKEARKRIACLMPSYEDITLDEIYESMSTFGLDKEDLEFLKSVELDIEMKLLQPRKSMIPLYNLAVSARKKIIIVSDMYLPTMFLKQVLDLNGFDQIHRYYVSSDLRKSKGRGGMFPFIINDLNCHPRSICHIGDNNRADVINPQKLNIQVFLWPKIMQLLKINQVHLSVWESKIYKAEPGFRILFGMIINEIFDLPPSLTNKPKSTFNGDPYTLGYYALGPFIFGLTKWINKKTLEQNTDTVHLVARDGYLIKHAFEILKPHLPGNLKVKYLRFSRRVTYPYCSASKHQFLTANKNYTYSSQISVRNMLQKFLMKNIDISLENYLISAGFDLEAPCENYEYIKLMSIVLKYSDDVFSDLKKQCEYANRYYKSLLEDEKKPVIFDVGYSGRAQKALSKIIDKSIHGLYIASYSQIFDNQDQHKYDNFIHSPISRFIEDLNFDPAILELLISEARSGSVVGFNETSSGIVPVLEDVFHQEKDLHTIDEIQSGALDFIRRVTALFGDDLQYIHTTTASSFKLLNKFMCHPDSYDTSILSDLTFYDSNSDSPMKIIDSTLKSSKWKQGYKSYMKKHSNNNKNSQLSRPKIKRFIKSELNTLRRLNSVDYINTVANFGEKQPSLALCSECISMIKHGKTKFYAAAFLLKKSGGIQNANISRIDKILCHAAIQRGR